MRFSIPWAVEWTVLAGIAAGWALGIGYWGTRRGWSAGWSVLWCAIGCGAFAASFRWGALGSTSLVWAFPEQIWGWWGGESVLAFGLRCAAAAAVVAVVTGSGRHRTAGRVALAVLAGAVASGSLPRCADLALTAVTTPGLVGSTMDGVAYPVYCAGRLVAATAEMALLSGAVAAGIYLGHAAARRRAPGAAGE